MTTERKIVLVNSFTGHDVSGVAQQSWIIEYEEEGTRKAVGFPSALLEWRAAEYGIDPQDPDTLLDIAIHERFFSLDTNDPNFLYNTDEKTARDVHLSRVAEVKRAAVLKDPDGLLEQIKQNHLRRHNTADHKARQAHVAELRHRKIMSLKKGQTQ